MTRIDEINMSGLTDFDLAWSMLDDAGCDCGVDEPGTCLACVCMQALRKERAARDQAQELLRRWLTIDHMDDGVRLIEEVEAFLAKVDA